VDVFKYNSSKEYNKVYILVKKGSLALLDLTAANCNYVRRDNEDW
jgi:hypothetical protein